MVAVAGLVAWYASDLPDIDQALTPTRKPAITVLADDGSVLATLGDFYGRPVAVADLPPALPRAVIATEDRRFYRHFGLDPIGLSRALYVNLRAGGVVQGGSTITQQAAKNLFLTHERTIKRKVQELMLALWLERPVQQGPDPRDLSQSRLFRRRQLWRGRGVAQVLRPAGDAGEHVSGGDAGGPAEGALAPEPAGQSGRGGEPGAHGIGQYGRCRVPRHSRKRRPPGA